MIIDARGINCAKIFKHIRSSVPHFYTEHDDFLIFVEPDDDQKIRIIKGFVETLMGCKADVLESSGYYIIQASREAAVTDNEVQAFRRVTYG